MDKLTFNARWDYCFKNDFDGMINRLILLIQMGQNTKPIVISEESRIKNIERVKKYREAQKIKI